MEVQIEPMTEDFILWRCLHSGPLSCDTIDQWPTENPQDWASFKKRNVPLLLQLTKTYGACGIVARTGNEIVGTLRFYPKIICEMKEAGYLCLQQVAPYGPADDFGTVCFPPLEHIQDRTLVVHCLMTGSPQQKQNPYQRKGIGARMVQELIQWAKKQGWHHIEATSFEDLPIIYEITGNAGCKFWEKLGFHLAKRFPHPELQKPNEFIDALIQQAKSAAISPERARDQLIMRFDL